MIKLAVEEAGSCWLVEFQKKSGEVCCLSHLAFGLHNVIYEVL